MRKASDYQDKIRRYLLGSLAEDEMQQIEERLMLDDQFYTEIKMAEGELIEDYIRGALRTGERKQFESSFLATAEGRKQVDLARQIRESSLLARETSSAKFESLTASKLSWSDSLISFLRSSFVIARSTALIFILLLVFFISWILISLWRAQSQIEELEARQSPTETLNIEAQRELEEMRARNNELMQELQREQEVRKALEQEIIALKTPDTRQPANPGQEIKPPSVATVFLVPGSVRSSGPKESVVITDATSRVQFNLALRRAGFSAYKVTLETEGNKTVWSAESVTSQPSDSGQKIVLRLPANVLESGQYIFKVSGVTAEGALEPVGNYYFTVTKR